MSDADREKQARKGVLAAKRVASTTRTVPGGAVADAVASALGSIPDSVLTTMLGPLQGLRTAAALSQVGRQAPSRAMNVTPSPVMPATEAALKVAQRVAPMPSSSAGKLTRAALSMAVPVPGAPKEAAAETALRAALDRIEQSAAERGASVSLGAGSRGINVSKIVVPKEMRGQGIGSNIMQQVTDLADQTGQRVMLSPSPDFGGSVPRLKQFYGRIGFVPNAGKTKDFSVSESMYRNPAPPQPTVAEVMGQDPYEAFHGSPTHGLESLRPGERGALGPASYLTPHSNVADRYAGPEGQIYRTQVNPSDIFDGMNYQTPSNINPYEKWRNQISRMVSVAPDNMKADVAQLGEKLGPKDGYPFYYRLAQLHGSDAAAQEHFKAAGFNGVAGWADGPEIAMFGDVPVQPTRLPVEPDSSVDTFNHYKLGGTVNHNRTDTHKALGIVAKAKR